MSQPKIISRKVKSLIKKINGQREEQTGIPYHESFEHFVYSVLTSYMTQQLSPEQAKVVVEFLTAEGYME